MCVVSYIGDEYARKFPGMWPNVVPGPTTWPPGSPPPNNLPLKPPVSREEFEALKREVEALKELLKAAKIFDEKTGQPDCHVDEKVGFIKKLADMLGVDMNEVFGPEV